MILTINRWDNFVVIDFEPRPVDCSPLPEDVRVVQWVETTGWLEYYNRPGDPYQANTTIDSIEPYQWAIDAWNAAPPNIEAPPPPEMFAHEPDIPSFNDLAHTVKELSVRVEQLEAELKQRR